MKLRENTTKKEINKDCTLSMPDWSEYTIVLNIY